VAQVPRITDDFHSLEDVGWYASIYQLASAALQPLSGRIYQKFNNKSSFLVFFAIFEIGSAVCGAATSSAMLIAGRAIAGIGSAGLVSGGLTITASAVPLEKRASLMGAILGFSQLGVAMGPLLGGAFTSYTTWRWCFYINLPIGALLVIGLFFIPLPDQTVKPSPWSVLRRLHVELDLLGSALMAAAAVQLLLALSWGGEKYSWDSATISGLFCGTGATAFLWLLWDWFWGDEALIPFSMMKVQAVWAGALTHCCVLTNILCASFFLPIYFQAVKGANPMMSGVYVLASVLSQLLVLPLAGRLGE
jgi:MFS family permease